MEEFLLKVMGKTDIGMVRRSNQDAYSGGELPGGAVWAAVCDGMGGANGGDIASKTAVSVLQQELNSGFSEDMPDQMVQALLLHAVGQANVRVYEKALEDEALSGMGTTVAAALVRGEKAYIVHVGDSRIYLLTPNEVTQLTTDHSIVQEMVKKGEITEQQAKNHPRKNIITRVVGVEPYVEADYDVCALPPDGKLLLCSDGLSNCVEPETMRRLAYELETDSLLDRLVSLANDAGGYDNITVAVTSA